MGEHCFSTEGRALGPMGTAESCGLAFGGVVVVLARERRTGCACGTATGHGLCGRLSEFGAMHMSACLWSLATLSSPAFPLFQSAAVAMAFNVSCNSMDLRSIGQKSSLPSFSPWNSAWCLARVDAWCAQLVHTVAPAVDLNIFLSSLSNSAASCGRWRTSLLLGI